MEPGGSARVLREGGPIENGEAPSQEGQCVRFPRPAAAVQTCASG